MTKMIQIRHVPDEVHRTLKERAAKEGMSLSDYLLREVEQFAAVPTLQEMTERLALQRPIDVYEPPEDIIRRARDAR